MPAGNTKSSPSISPLTVPEANGQPVMYCKIINRRVTRNGGGKHVKREVVGYRIWQSETPRAKRNSWNGPSMNKEVTICLRIDEATARRIEHVLSSGCPTRSRFIRAAIERALSLEEGQVRLHAAHSAIAWD